MNQSTAILFFSRSPTAEAGYKPCNGIPMQVNLQLKKTLFHHSLDVIQATGIPYFHIDEHLQHGESFGERLGNAFELIFSKGFQQVIAIGNDGTNLKSKDILTAAIQLNECRMVLAKDIHGGACLIGVNISAFDKKAFQNLRWQTRLIFTDLRQMFDAAVLPGLFIDINTVGDIRSAIKRLSARESLARFFVKICCLLQCAGSQYRERYIIPAIFTLFSLRDPPVLF